MNAQQERHAAVMRLRASARTLRKIQRIPDTPQRMERLAAFWRAIEQDAKTAGKRRIRLNPADPPPEQLSML